MNVCMCVRVRLCMCAYVYMCVRVCMGVCEYMCVCARVRVYVCKSEFLYLKPPATGFLVEPGNMYKYDRLLL